MSIQLSEHFNYSKLIRFTIPTIVMMIFTSIYGVVDGMFVSNFVGKTPFAAVNLIMPALMILGTIGFMLGTGGSAIVAKTLGEGKKKLANEYFTILVVTAAVCGVVLAVVGWIFMRPLAVMLGAQGEMLEYCVTYARIIMIALPGFMLQNVFQSFLVTAEKPHLGLYLTVIAGVTNMVLDFVFIVVFEMGIAGAAYATCIGQTIGGFVPFIYFLRKNSSALRMTRCHFDGSVLRKACFNGSSEMMTNLSMSLVNMLYNYQLMRFIGADGVAAYGVIMYINFIFTGVFFGYSVGCAPIVGFHYGAGNQSELKNLFRKSLILMTAAGVVLTGLALAASAGLSKIFVGYDAGLYELTKRGFRIYTLSFLMMGINIYGSAFFTALNNGLVSAIISFLRTLLFQVAAVVILPALFGIDGVWMSIVAAECLAIVVTILFFIREKGRYHYV